MARLSVAAFGTGGVNPISTGTSTAAPVVFVPFGTGLKNPANICGATGQEESPGRTGQITGPKGISELFVSPESAAVAGTALMVFVAAGGIVFKTASLVALVMVPADGCSGRNDFQAYDASGFVANSNRIGAGPMLGR